MVGDPEGPGGQGSRELVLGRTYLLDSKHPHSTRIQVICELKRHPGTNWRGFD